MRSQIVGNTKTYTSKKNFFFDTLLAELVIGMSFTSAWPTVLNWVVLGFWIVFVTYNPWQVEHYKKYERYRSDYRNGTFLFYPPLWAYKIIWGFVNACVAAGGVIAAIQLDATTEWYVSIFSIAYANILAQKWFPVFYFEWNNWRSLATILTVFIMASAGAVAGLMGYRAFEENEMSVWAAFAFWALYFLWVTYALALILSTEYPLWDATRGWVTPGHMATAHHSAGYASMHMAKSGHTGDMQMGMFSQNNKGGMNAMMSGPQQRAYMQQFPVSSQLSNMNF